MSLLGKGVVAIWHEVQPAARADFFEWHNREHMLERVGIPGFLRGRRYSALTGEPEICTLYETESVEVLTGPHYMARLENPGESRPGRSLFSRPVAGVSGPWRR